MEPDGRTFAELRQRANATRISFIETEISTC
jgi:hypothetical protein